jgi:O-succinylbenzoic acid--CoA ligase
MVKPNCRIHFDDDSVETLSLIGQRNGTLVPIHLKSDNPLNSEGIKSVIQAVNKGLTPVILGNDKAKVAWEKLSQLISMEGLTDKNTVAVIATSGTTGEPKWVPINLRQVQSSVENAPAKLLPTNAGSWLLSLPIHHTGGLAVLFRSLLNGNDVVVAGGMKSENILAILDKYPHIQSLSLVPKQLYELIEQAENPISLFQGKSILLGGGPVSTSLRKQIHELKLSVFYSYGMSETFGQLFAINAQMLNEAETEQNIAGIISKENNFKITEDERLLVQGPQLFKGYLGQNEQETFDEGNWFDTGDLAQINGFGRLEILMRRTDLIVSGGKNIRPQEVEDRISEICSIPGSYFVITGFKDAIWGEIVGLCIEESALKNYNLSIAEKMHSSKKITHEKDTTHLLDALSKALPKDLLPRKVKVVKELPKTALGKIKRAEIKALFNA